VDEEICKKSREYTLNQFVEETENIIKELKHTVKEVSKELNYKTTEDAEVVLKRVKQPLNEVNDYSNKWLFK
jgi:small-conductance mechanosensitive channel